jgi:hypothetical protein
MLNSVLKTNKIAHYRELSVQLQNTKKVHQ